MNKKFFFDLMLAIVAFGVAVLWLVSLFVDIPLEGGFTIYWAIAILSSCAGLIFILRGVMSKSNATFQKISIIFGAVLLIVALLAVVQNYANSDKYILPIIAIIISAALIICVFVAKGRAWDAGDNQKPDYKNYYQRKAEEEAKKQAEDANKQAEDANKQE